jgi:hypothetical protein
MTIGASHCKGLCCRLNLCEPKGGHGPDLYKLYNQTFNFLDRGKKRAVSLKFIPAQAVEMLCREPRIDRQVYFFSDVR